MGAAHGGSPTLRSKKTGPPKFSGTIHTLFGGGKNTTRYAPIKYSPVRPGRKSVDKHFKNIIGEHDFEDVIGADQDPMRDKESLTKHDPEDMWIRDLDKFFIRMYEFYTNQGFACVVGQHVVNLINIGFTVGFSTFCFLFVDWSLLLQCDGARDDNCGTFSDYIVSDHLFTITPWHIIVYTYFLTFSIYWIWSLISFFPLLKQNWEIHVFVRDRLKIKTKELQTMQWSEVVDKLIQLHRTRQIRTNRNVLTAHDIASRILRKDNYMIAFFNRGVLNLTVPPCLLACWRCVKGIICCQCCRKRTDLQAASSTPGAKSNLSIYLTHHLQVSQTCSCLEFLVQLKGSRRHKQVQSHHYLC